MTMHPAVEQCSSTAQHHARTSQVANGPHARRSQDAANERATPLQVGRTDASQGDQDVNEELPDASDKVQELKDIFARKGFNTREMVVLSGAHTVRTCCAAANTRAR